MSLKQRGNQAFRCQKYRQAIELYEKYVQQQHSDNKNAFFNMALCYSKLKQHQKSIEACKSAIAIDPTYEKVYYRMMKQYFQLKNPYQVFINARLYVRNQKDQSSAQIVEAKEYMRLYKDYFINKIAKQQPHKKIEENDQIFQLIEPLQPKIQAKLDFNEQIDKYPNEWIEEWAQGIQSQQAKWLEIQYIIQELDYNHGIQLAYLYLNQQNIPKKRKEILEKIKAIKKQMKKEQILQGEEGYFEEIEAQKIPLFNEVVEEILNDQIRVSPQKLIKTAQNVQNGTKQQKKIQNIDVRNEKQVEKQMKSQKVNKIQQLLQKKSQRKNLFEQSQQEPTQKKPQKAKQQQKKQVKVQPTPKKVKPIQKKTEIKQKKSSIVTATTSSSSFPQQKSEEQLQILYKSYCGVLQKKGIDIFVQLYKSIFQILKSKQNTVTIGQLLILLKKRNKKFKVIVASFSENEQALIFDLLSKHKMEQYAVDFAPKYHKL